MMKWQNHGEGVGLRPRDGSEASDWRQTGVIKLQGFQISNFRLQSERVDGEPPTGTSLFW